MLELNSTFRFEEALDKYEAAAAKKDVVALKTARSMLHIELLRALDEEALICATICKRSDDLTSAINDIRNRTITISYDLSEMFFMQDSRSYVGNDVLWWGNMGGGYTSDIRKARIFTKAEAQRQHDTRPSDIPWPVSYILTKTRPAVDMQYIDRNEAIKSSGITMHKPKKIKKDVYRCCCCGRFITWKQSLDACPNCGTNNAP